MNKEKIRKDIVIVGAGPSGCSAASVLLDNHRDVLIIDKESFPRHKSCAGGLTPKTVNNLPFELNHLEQHSSKKMDFKFTNGKTVHLKHNDGACKMVIREDFDHHFFNFVINKGAKFLKEKIDKITDNKDYVQLETDTKIIDCKFLIGADGANSTVRRLATSLKFKNPVFAFEGLVKKEHCTKKSATKFVFNKLGYGWIFPKHDHYNVGIGNLIRDASCKKPKKADLLNFVVQELGCNKLESITGFPIGTEGTEYTPESKRIYLIGDAAGLAETLLGEGIYNAVMSGKYIANSIISSSDLNTVYTNYKAYLHSLKKELSLYSKGAKVLYKRQRMSYWMLKLFFGKKFMDGYSEGKTLTEIIKGKYPFPSI